MHDEYRGKNKSLVQNMKKILIIRNDHIGDLVYSTPIFREIKRAMPDSEITVIASPSNRPIIEKNPHIDRIIELDIAKKSFSSVLSYFKMSMKLRKEKFDYGIDLRGSTMNCWFLLKLAGVKRKISHIEWHPNIRGFLDVALNFNKKAHIFEDNRALLKMGMGIDIKDDWPEVITDEEDKRIVDTVIKDNNLDKFICVCPIAGLPEKQWALENFRHLIDWLYETYPEHKIVLIGTEKDRYTMQMGLAVPGSVILVDFNVRRLPLLFKRASLVIAMDGGPLHEAWLTGAKTLALYPAEVADKFFPLRNCRTFQSDSTQDMLSIELKDVKKAVGEML